LSSSIDKAEALKRIDKILQYVEDNQKMLNEEIFKYPFDSDMQFYLENKAIVSMVLRLKQTIVDIAPKKSEYWSFANSVNKPFSINLIYELVGALQSLRNDYANNFLKNFNEMIDADLFSDILEQAEYLLSQDYVIASAVVAGVALESHLRKLAEKNSIPITTDDMKYIKADSLNGALLKSNVIDKTMHKIVTSWLGLRNGAAHPDPKEINYGLIEPMIAGIKVFIQQYPA
jgi:hypothetical protein